MGSCNLCGKPCSVHRIELSNGTFCHTDCLSSLEKEFSVLQQELSGFDRELNTLEARLNNIDSLFSRLRSVFSSSPESKEDLEKMIFSKGNDRKRIVRRFERVKFKLTSVYDLMLDYPPDWEKRREYVLSKSNDLCSECGYGGWGTLHVHHKIPLKNGGTNRVNNLVALCEDCHRQKHGGRAFSNNSYSSNTASRNAFPKRVSSIDRAISQGRLVEFSYKKPTDRSYQKRIVKPSEMVNIPHRDGLNSTLCLKGICSLRNAERVFALKRMKGLKVK